jgi:hypothetical protein
VLVISKNTGTLKTAINFFYKRYAHNYTHVSHRKNLADRWDLPNAGILYSKDVASA